MGISIGFIRTIFKGSTKSVAKTVAEAPALRGTIVRPSLPGVTSLERQFGDKLFISETKTLANGSKQTTTAVYSGNGQYIGKGGSEGLAALREKTITRQPNESIFGGDKVEINKNYRETFGMTAHNENIVKEYTPSGIMEHSTTTTKYSHWDSPKTTVYDRTKSLNGETAYSKAIEAKKAEELAAKAEQEAIAAATKKEQEAAAKLLAEQPRVNVGKVFNKNFDELKKMQEKVLDDGTVVRKYATKNKNGANQYIVTKDKGSYHEEHIIDTAKDIKIKFTQIGKKAPEITMQKGWQLRQTPEGQLYTDGKQMLELDYGGNPQKFRIKGTNGLVSGYREIPDFNYGVACTPYTPIDRVANWNLKVLSENVHKKYVDLNDLFRPYKA